MERKSNNDNFGPFHSQHDEQQQNNLNNNNTNNFKTSDFNSGAVSVGAQSPNLRITHPVSRSEKLGRNSINNGIKNYFGRSLGEMPHEVNLNRPTEESNSGYSIADQPYWEIKCYLKIASRQNCKFKGVCAIKAGSIVFYNEKEFRNGLVINILSIISIEPISSKKKFNTQHIKLTLVNEEYIFIDWPSYIKQFFYVYVQREQYRVSNINNNKGLVSKSASNVSIDDENEQNDEQGDGKSNESYVSVTTDSLHSSSLFTKILNDLKLKFTKIFEGNLPLTVNQAFNVIKGTGTLATRFKENYGDLDLHVTDWHIDIDGNVVVDISFTTHVRLIKNITTRIKSMLQWPYIENQLIFLKDTVVINNVLGVNSSVVVYHLLGFNPDAQTTTLAVYALVECHGTVISTGMIRNKIIKTFVTRTKALEAYILRLQQEIVSDKTLNKFCIKNVPKELLAKQNEISNRKINLPSDIIESAHKMDSSDNFDEKVHSSQPHHMFAIGNFRIGSFCSILLVTSLIIMIGWKFNRFFNRGAPSKTSVLVDHKRLERLENLVEKIAKRLDEIPTTK